MITMSGDQQTGMKLCVYDTQNYTIRHMHIVIEECVHGNEP